ncbi:MAG: DUF3488 domain-containing protein [Thermoguttaceae bacterium]|nr:DUF3488 domain-containing protein [Thermoguttaceae bacterium]
MSFIISFILACATILATFMLQLVGDPQKTGSVLSVVSFFAILTALYLVDFKKKFAISKTLCNILILIAVAAQLPALFRSREEFLAFSIANILATLPTILFFQRKTLRKSYQILVITFVEVAVGCVFQRNPLFVAVLPIYAVLAFVSFSLLFQWNERKFYSERIVLKNRFVGNKNLQMITVEESTEPANESVGSLYDNRAAYNYGQKVTPIGETRFFRRPVIAKLSFDYEFFRRFVVNAMGACLFAALFFCLFPRLDQIGFGGFEFEPVDWGANGRGRSVKTGFKSSIELGDLGPAINSRETVMKVKFVDPLNPDEPANLNFNYPVYFRGVALAGYQNGVWSNLNLLAPKMTARELSYAIRVSSSTDPSSILPKSALNADETTESAPFEASQIMREGRRRKDNFSIPERFNPVIVKPTFFPQPPCSLPSIWTPLNKLSPKEADRNLKEYCLAQKDALLYDVRAKLVNIKIELNRLDEPVVFAAYPFYVARNSDSLETNGGQGVRLRTDPKGGQSEFWFLATGFADGRQMELTPNQEMTLPFLDQYLALDVERFPKLVETAKRWDAESGIDPDDFVSRARYFEVKLRDSGAYAYDRKGTIRDPDLDPLEDFVVEHKQGHCEYFAGALALLLRAVGIPSRVVVGYAREPSDDGSDVEVRQSDAHSWVEAFVPLEKLPKRTSPYSYLYAGSSIQNDGSDCLPAQTREWIGDGAWFRLDPTPAAERNAERPSALAINIYNLSALLKSFGNDFVMNFNGARQARSVYRPIVEAWKSFISGLRKLSKNLNFVKTILKDVYNTAKNFATGKWTPDVVARFAFLISAFASLFFILWRLGAKFARALKKTLEEARENKRKLEAKRCWDERAAELYREVEKFFRERLQTTRLASETQREFLSRCFSLEDEREKETSNAETPFVPTPRDVRKKLRELVERFYRAQFGKNAMTNEEFERWNDLLKKAIAI